MNILICNDDGYQAKGIRVLTDIVSQYAKVRVIAPDRNRTAASQSLTLHKPLMIQQAENKFYYVNGTPTDCVYLALSIFNDFKPDWIFSGINHGANLGDDILYSGTVAAATQGYLMGVPSIAFSLNDTTDCFWQTAEKALYKIIPHIINLELVKPVLWNINFPKVEQENLKGIKTVVLGQRCHNERAIIDKTPYGKTVYWIGLNSEVDDIDKNSDFALNKDGYVTVTPITVDLTNFDELKGVDEIFTSLTL